MIRFRGIVLTALLAVLILAVVMVPALAGSPIKSSVSAPIASGDGLPATTDQADVKGNGHFEVAPFFDADPQVWLHQGIVQVFLMLGMFGWSCYAFPLVGRITDPLLNPARKRIREYIDKNPGCTLTEISRDLDINDGTAKHHLDKLLHFRKIIVKDDGKYTRHYGNIQSMREHEHPVYNYIRSDQSRCLLRMILDHPGITNKGLTETSGLTKSTVNWYKDRFMGHDIIQEHREGRNRRYFIRDDMREIIRQSGP